MTQLKPFSATLSAPGYLDIITIHATDAVDAQERAEAFSCEPFSDMPYTAFRLGKGAVSVRPAMMPTTRAAE